MTKNLDSHPTQSNTVVYHELDNLQSKTDSREAHTAERDELEVLRKYAHEATKAITGLAGGGSEFFGKKIGKIYTADLPFCVTRIRERESRSHERLLKSVLSEKESADKLADKIEDFIAEFDKEALPIIAEYLCERRHNRSALSTPHTPETAPVSEAGIRECTIKAFRDKYREIWPGSHPDNKTIVELLSAVFAADNGEVAALQRAIEAQSLEIASWKQRCEQAEEYPTLCQNCGGQGEIIKGPSEAESLAVSCEECAGSGNVLREYISPECEDCPPIGYPTDETRCSPCPRRSASLARDPLSKANRSL